jgi:hypothetical protein
MPVSSQGHYHYGSKVPAVTVTVFKYRNKIGKIVVKANSVKRRTDNTVTKR